MSLIIEAGYILEIRHAELKNVKKERILLFWDAWKIFPHHNSR
jgi:hypothetical protein